MDTSSLLVLFAICACLVLTFGGAKSRSIGERVINAGFSIEQAIRSFYARLSVVSKTPSTPAVVRFLLFIFVRVSWYLWVAAVTLFFLLLLYGKALRSVIRYTI